jgi:hypothetical protein
MKRIIGLALGFVLLSATPASAEKIGVDAGDAAVAWDSTEHADVFVSTYGGGVSLYGSSYDDPDYGWDSSAWVTIRVKGVGPGALTVRTPGTGDCTGKTMTFSRKPHHVVVVRIQHDAVAGDEFDCTYKRVVVRWP